MSRASRANFIEMRRSERNPVNHVTTAEHTEIGEVSLRIVNISPQGFMVRDAPALEKGTRIEVRLPVIGKIEGHLMWSHEGRSGFQLERIIRPHDFETMLSKLSSSAS